MTKDKKGRITKGPKFLVKALDETNDKVEANEPKPGVGIIISDAPGGGKSINSTLGVTGGGSGSSLPVHPDEVNAYALTLQAGVLVWELINPSC